MDSYNDVPYRSIALPQTHPDRLAVHARLFGLDPAPLADCRVLDVGCGDGANLLPMAAMFPASTFVGIDNTARPIEDGRERVEGWGIPNLDLRVANLGDLSPSLGTFDYIVAHGVYSWVPDDVREALLALLAERLAPHGIAFVSYNALPGGHLRRLTREMMCYHIDGLEAPGKRVQQARALLDFLIDGQPEESPYLAVLEDERNRSTRYTDEHFFHDHIADINRPFYFHEFVERAGNHGLAYLAEADFAAMQDRAFPAETRAALAGLDRLRREQYLDFLRNRMLRQTLLCRSEASPSPAPDPDRVRNFTVAAPVRRSEGEDASDSITFLGVEGKAVRTGHPFAVAVCEHLGAAWPEAVSFDALWAATSHAASDGITEAMLAQMLLDFYADGFVHLHTHAPVLARTVSARPKSIPVVRRQAEAGPDEDGVLVTNAWHQTVSLGARQGRLLAMLDGTRSHADLGAAFDGDSEASLMNALDGFVRNALLVV